MAIAPFLFWTLTRFRPTWYGLPRWILMLMRGGIL